MTRSTKCFSIFAFFLLFRELHDDEIEDEIREAFRCFDRDGHGFIPVSGLQNMKQHNNE